MKALIIVDIQNDFLPGGALPVQDGDKIIPLVNHIITRYNLVVASQDWHPATHSSFAANHHGDQANKTSDINSLDQVLWPIHCVEYSEGAKFSGTLLTQHIDEVVRKGTNPEIDSYSAFYDNGHKQSTGLAELLRERGITEVDIVGLTTDYCVKFTALDAVKEGFHTNLLLDACRGVNLKEGDTEKAIDEMKAAGVLISQINFPETITLYRPTGQKELDKVQNTGWKKWPPRFYDQPLFYPVTNKQYASEIADKWNTKDSKNDSVGYVTQFSVKADFLKNYNIECVGAKHHTEYWIPSRDLEQLNKNIVGTIEVIEKFQPLRPDTNV